MNGHVRDLYGFKEVQGGNGLGKRNMEEEKLLEFAPATNSSYAISNAIPSL